jgi:hypothetical protein
MPGPSTYSALVTLREQIAKERQQEVVRAIGFRESDPRRSAYHTGLADGKNGIIDALNTILNSASITKGDRRSGRD